jgi:hypothetical protein
LLISHSEDRAKRGVSKNGPVDAAVVCIRRLLSVIPYKDAPRTTIKLPKRSTKRAYEDVASLKSLRFVKERA